MAKIEWGTVSEKTFEAGVDRGVFYPKQGGGVAWNGLINVTENPEGGSVNAFYQNGYKYHNEVGLEEFASTIEAFTYPPEFARCDGSETSGRGLFYEQQTRESFGMSYRTTVGNDVDGLSHGYKIHLVYNALVAPSTKSHETLDDSNSPMTLSWPVTTSPVVISGRKPTGHLIVDSRTSSAANLRTLEDVLYGAPGRLPRLPTPSEVVTIFNDWPFLEIIPDTANGLAQLKHKGLHDLQGDSSVGLYKAPPETRLKPLSIDGLYRLEL